MINKIKAHIREIIIVILALFGLSKCTQSCNRQTKLDKAEITIVQKDSIIDVLINDTLTKAHQIDMLAERLNTANEKVNVANEKINVANAKEETASANAKTAKAIAEKERLRKELNNK